jgi:glycosyltransferase involved in cell wall biosynthesis
MPITTSVVIPVKNDARELDRCLIALCAQTVAPDEVIVVDNGSADDSADVAVSHGARLVRCDAPGIPAAAATGYNTAAKDLILRLDADCIPPVTWVQDVITAFRSDESIDALTGWARFIDGPLGCRKWAADLYLGAYVGMTAPALGHRPLFGSNLAMRRAAWEAVRDDIHRDAELHDDLDLAYHLGARHRIGVLRGEPMGVSMRPFFSVRSFRRRLRRGFRTVFVHWPDEFPPHRWSRLWRGRTLRPGIPRMRPAR